MFSQKARARGYRKNFNKFSTCTTGNRDSGSIRRLKGTEQYFHVIWIFGSERVIYNFSGKKLK